MSYCNFSQIPFLLQSRAGVGSLRFPNHVVTAAWCQGAVSGKECEGEAWKLPQPSF